MKKASKDSTFFDFLSLLFSGRNIIDFFSIKMAKNTLAQQVFCLLVQEERSRKFWRPEIAIWDILLHVMKSTFWLRIESPFKH